MFSVPSTDTIRLLDAGAGVGTLAAAVCDRVAKLQKPKTLEIALYENDTTVIPLLEKTMEGARRRLSQGGHGLTYTIFSDDFILSNQNAQLVSILGQEGFKQPVRLGYHESAVF